MGRRTGSGTITDTIIANHLTLIIMADTDTRILKRNQRKSLRGKEIKRETRKETRKSQKGRSITAVVALEALILPNQTTRLRR